MTHKQIQIMTIVIAGNGVDADGKFVPADIDQLLERLPYKTTKDSMHFSLRALMRRGMIEKGEVEARRGRKRRPIVPTDLGKSALSATASAPVIEPAGSAELLETLE